ncbi:hypothetical protein QQ045_005948 [Rhodiola kirilowii]
MGERRLVLLGLGTAMVVGILVYFRLWFMDYTISSDETDLLRKQFDLANRDAMDESADWRMRYDREVERASKCADELSKVFFFFTLCNCRKLSLYKTIMFIEKQRNR